MENIMENIQDFKRIEKNKPQQQELVDTINIKSTGSTKKYIAYAVKLLINEKFPTIYLKASGNAVNRALITADILRKKIKGLAQINEVKSEEIEDEYIKKNCENSEKNEKNEKVIIKKNFALLQITLSNENNLDHSHYGYQPPIPVEKVKEFGTSFLPKDGCFLNIKKIFNYF